MSKWGKARLRYLVDFVGMHKAELGNENVTPVLFKKKNSKIRSEYFRNLEIKNTFKP